MGCCSSPRATVAGVALLHLVSRLIFLYFTEKNISQLANEFAAKTHIDYSWHNIHLL